MSLNWFLIPTILYSLLTFIRLNFLNLKSFKTSKDFNTTSQLITVNNYNYLYFFYLVIFTSLVCLTNPYLTSFISFSNFSS